MQDLEVPNLIETVHIPDQDQEEDKMKTMKTSEIILMHMILNWKVD